MLDNKNDDECCIKMSKIMTNIFALIWSNFIFNFQSETRAWKKQKSEHEIARVFRFQIWDYI